MRTLCSSELALVSGGTSPGDGVYEPADHAFYTQQAAAWGNAALIYGAGAGLAGLAALGLAIPTAGVGSLWAGGVSGAAGLTALVAQQRAAEFARMEMLEARDRDSPRLPDRTEQQQEVSPE